jgi:hypothetical protein
MFRSSSSNTYYYKDYIKKDWIDMACSTHEMRGKRSVHSSSVGKPEGRRLLGRSRGKWKYNI